jgi:spore photoproduct lyase
MSSRILSRLRQIKDGSIIKRFDKTPIPEKPTDVVCPHFFELKWATGCPFDCSWCYLKGTLRFLPQKAKPRIKDYSKIESHVKAFFSLADHPKEILNTGELADSLMFENSGRPFSKFIISLFEKQSKHKVLFLTKSANVKNLLEINKPRQVIVSFSLNADEVARKWEKKAPRVQDRIKAAREIQQADYETRIRIDPIIPVPNWDKYYLRLIDDLFKNLTPERITLGSLRGLQSTINGSTDKSWLKYLSEYSNWGKKVEFTKRYEMYRTILDYLLDKHNFRQVALCKETKAMWEKLGLDYKKIRCNCVW